MNYFKYIQSTFARNTKNVRLGACLAMMGLISFSAQAQATNNATSTLTINLVVTGTTNPNSCGVGASSASQASTSIVVPLTATTSSGDLKGVNPTGTNTTTSGISVYCPSTTFTVSANGGSANAAFSDTQASRTLTNGTNTASYYLTFGTTAPTSTSSNPVWGGSNSTSCVAGYTGTATNSNTGTLGTTGGCYKSPTMGSSGTTTVVYIPWGYYIVAPAAGFQTGTYTDTVNLSLNY